MVVHGGLRAGRDDQRREGKAAVSGAIEEPRADTGTHPAVGGRLLILLGKPGLVSQQLGEMRPDRGQDLARVIVLISDPSDLRDERAKSRVVDHILVLSGLNTVGHGYLLGHSASRLR